MAGLHSHARFRRVVTGLDTAGKSTIVSDELISTRLVSPGNMKTDVWRVESLPIAVDGWDGLEGGVVTSPSVGGLVYRFATVPPDSEWDMSAGYSDANGPLEGMVDPAEAGGIAGLHFTETIDIVTVVSGELWAILETTETALRTGDTLVQRGTKHAWQNRTNQPATLIALMMSAKR